MPVGVQGQRKFVFQTPGENANYIRGLPCEIWFLYKRPWIKETGEETGIKKLNITV